MFQYSERSDLFNQILLLQGSSPEVAKNALNTFTETYSLSEYRSFLWMMVECCLTTDHHQFADPPDRIYLLSMNRDIQTLFEAVFVIAEFWANQQKAGK